MPKPYHQIVVPVDFSNHATLALAEAAEIAQRYGAQLTVIYVIPQAIFHPDLAAEMEEVMDLSDIVEETKRTLADMVAPYRSQGLEITVHVLAGGPYTEIVRMAKQVEADLIVMGAHGTTQGGSTLAGSVAEHVMRLAPCSVFTVRESAAMA